MINNGTTHPTVNPCCYKCRGPTRLYRRVLDPQMGKDVDLYECVVCAVITTRSVAAKVAP